MKRQLTSLCSLFLALLLVLSLVGCNNEAPTTDSCNHQWQAATCTLPKTCTLCGAREGEKIADAHAWLLTDEVAPECQMEGEETHHSFGGENRHRLCL